MPTSNDEEKPQKPEPVRRNPASESLDLEPIRKAIQGIRFGEVRIVIQDGLVIQIDRMEKQRIR